MNAGPGRDLVEFSNVFIERPPNPTCSSMTACPAGTKKYFNNDAAVCGGSECVKDDCCEDCPGKCGSCYSAGDTLALQCDRGTESGGTLSMRAGSART